MIGQAAATMPLAPLHDDTVRRIWRGFRPEASSTGHRYHLPMPVVFRYRGYRFFFYSNEGSPREPVHVHAMGEGGEAKFWLYPSVHVAWSDGWDARTLRELTAEVERQAPLVERKWHEFFGD